MQYEVGYHYTVPFAKIGHTYDGPPVILDNELAYYLSAAKNDITIEAMVYPDLTVVGRKDFIVALAHHKLGLDVPVGIVSESLRYGHV